MPMYFVIRDQTAQSLYLDGIWRRDFITNKLVVSWLLSLPPAGSGPVGHDGDRENTVMSL